jgi:formylglycine-generating enzyme required for sulfatase activity
MAYLGDLNVATGVDTSYRPGEAPWEYFARIGREGAEYSKFLDSQKAGAGVSQPLLPTAPTATAPAKKPPSNALKVIVVGGGLLALAYVLLKKP